MLHASDNISELRQITTENVELVHSPHFVQYTALLLEQGNKGSLVFRIVAECFVDKGTGAPERANGPSRHPTQFRVLLHDQKCLENGAGLPVEDVFVDNVEELVDGLESRTDRYGRVGMCRENRRADVLQKNGVELGDDLRCPVILLHQLLTGQQRG